MRVLVFNSLPNEKVLCDVDMSYVQCIVWFDGTKQQGGSTLSTSLNTS